MDNGGAIPCPPRRPTAQVRATRVSHRSPDRFACLEVPASSSAVTEGSVKVRQNLGQRWQPVARPATTRAAQPLGQGQSDTVRALAWRRRPPVINADLPLTRLPVQPFTDIRDSPGLGPALRDCCIKTTAHPHQECTKLGRPMRSTPVDLEHRDDDIRISSRCAPSSDRRLKLATSAFSMPGA